MNNSPADRSGYGATSAWTGTEAYVDGPFGQAVANTNAAGYVDTGSRFETVLNGSFTICAWCITTDPTEASLRSLLGNEESLVTVQGFLFRKASGANTMSFIGHNGTAQQFSIDSTVTGDIPNHFVGVYTGSEAFFYKNGELAGSDASATGSFVSPGNNLKLGEGETANRQWKGYAWGFRLYSCSLTGDEVAALHDFENGGHR